MNRYDDRARLVFHFAREEGSKLGHAMIGPEHLLLGLMREGGTASKVLTEFGASLEGIRQQVEEMVGRGDGLPRNETAAITPRARRVMELAGSEARSVGSNVIATEHILLGVIREGDGVAYRILQQLTRDVDTVRWRLLAAGDPKKTPETVATPFLDEYARDLTKEAREDKLDPVIGRTEEIRRVIQILSRRTKNNPVLIGEPGVGKTAIVEGLAQAIVDGRVPPNLAGVRVLAIDLSNVVAGTKYRGEFEERLRQIIEELKAAKVVAFIDELHTLVGAGGAEGTLDAANILKPPLSRGEVQVVGATTTGEYHRYIEKDAALERRFQPVIVLEPTPEESLQILHGLREKYEAHHGVVIPVAILELSVRYGERSLPGRNFPDKAIDLIDEAASRTRLNKSLGFPVLEGEDGTPIVSREDVEAVVNSWGGIYVDDHDGERLTDLERRLKRAVVGQDKAIVALAAALRRARVGLGGRTRVSASFLFVGPSGVGKTYLAKQLALELFGSERSLVRLDMSEYQESHAISKLIGAPPGYVGSRAGRPPDRGRAPTAVLGGPARRDREGAPRHLQHLPAGARRRPAHRRPRPAGRLPPRDPHHDLEHRLQPRGGHRLPGRDHGRRRRAAAPHLRPRVPRPARRGHRVPDLRPRGDLRHHDPDARRHHPRARQPRRGRALRARGGRLPGGAPARRRERPAAAGGPARARRGPAVGRAAGARERRTDPGHGRGWAAGVRPAGPDRLTCADDARGRGLPRHRRA
jgi:ATP-dependent Clp protease ATP-binding subunit ClpC